MKCFWMQRVHFRIQQTNGLHFVKYTLCRRNCSATQWAMCLFRLVFCCCKFIGITREKSWWVHFTHKNETKRNYIGKINKRKNSISSSVRCYGFASSIQHPISSIKWWASSCHLPGATLLSFWNHFACDEREN